MLLDNKGAMLKVEKGIKVLMLQSNHIQRKIMNS